MRGYQEDGYKPDCRKEKMHCNTACGTRREVGRVIQKLPYATPVTFSSQYALKPRFQSPDTAGAPCWSVRLAPCNGRGLSADGPRYLVHDLLCSSRPRSIPSYASLPARCNIRPFCLITHPHLSFQIKHSDSDTRIDRSAAALRRSSSSLLGRSHTLYQGHFPILVQSMAAR